MKKTESYEQLSERFSKRTKQILSRRDNLTEGCPAWHEHMSNIIILKGAQTL